MSVVNEWLVAARLKHEIIVRGIRNYGFLIELSFMSNLSFPCVLIRIRNLAESHKVKRICVAALPIFKNLITLGHKDIYHLNLLLTIR